MRQAVRVGRQILLPRIRSRGKTGIQSVAAVSSTNVWAVGGQGLCTFRFKRFVTLGWQHVESRAPYLSPQSRESPHCSCDGRGAAAFASNRPIVASQTWTGEIVLPKELGALDGPVLSDLCFERQL